MEEKLNIIFCLIVLIFKNNKIELEVYWIWNCVILQIDKFYFYLNW